MTWLKIPEPAQKACTKCKATKPIGEFYRANTGRQRSKRHSWCKVCLNELTVKLQREKYGVSRDAYATMEKKQNNKCAICGAGPSEKRKSLDADHDHVSGLFRGLLCHKCNRMIGLANEKISVLLSAVAYLKRVKQ